MMHGQKNTKRSELYSDMQKTTTYRAVTTLYN